MRQVLGFGWVGVSAVVLLMAPLAHAAENAPRYYRPLDLGLRLGVAAPLGDLSKDGYESRLNETFNVKIPVLFEASYEVAPGLLLGIHAQWGVLSEKLSHELCHGLLTCFAYDVEVGIQAQYHFSRGEAVDPWLGLGAGYEFEHDSHSDGGEGQTRTLRGPQFCKLQGGVDFRIADGASLGPFLSLSFAEYTNGVYNEVGRAFESPALHEWFTFGAKGTFQIGDN